MSENIIVVKNLSKYFGEIKAVEGISFSVKKGEIFAFLGPNGAGKSTTIKMLTTLLEADSGTINVNGFSPEKDKDNIRKSFGIVFQDPSVDEDLTAWENMEFHALLYGIPKKERLIKIKELLEFVELWDRRNDLVSKFSGGMRRRLEIARGLLHHPKILFLDEPTLGLDPQTKNHMWNYIREINKKEGMTVFFTTHYMDEAEKMAQKVAIIDHGKIITQGTVESLKRETKSKSLEEAFLVLTGDVIRNEEATPTDFMRNRRPR